MWFRLPISFNRNVENKLHAVVKIEQNTNEELIKAKELLLWRNTELLYTLTSEQGNLQKYIDLQFKFMNSFTTFPNHLKSEIKYFKQDPNKQSHLNNLIEALNKLS